jgi:hypothetical protein
MKSTLYVIAISIFFLSCKSSNKKVQSDCSRIRKVRLGYISLYLPSCYKVYHPDTTDEAHFVIAKDDSVKLEGEAGSGLVSLQAVKDIQNEKSVTSFIDTSGNILTQVGYYKKGGKFGMVVNIIDFKNKITLFNDMLKDLKGKRQSNIFADHQFIIKLNAGTRGNVYLSSEDVDVLVLAFKKSKTVSQINDSISSSLL